MSDRQMNLFMKKADQEPKLRVPASIEKEAIEMLEPEERKNVVVVDNYKTESNSENAAVDTNTRVHSERAGYAQQSGLADMPIFLQFAQCANRTRNYNGLIREALDPTQRYAGIVSPICLKDMATKSLGTG